MTCTLSSERSQHTLVLSLANPGHDNQLSVAICAALVEALTVADTDKSVRTLVLRGHGAPFCGGLTVQRGETATDVVAAVSALMLTLPAMTKPVLAAVEGGAAGLGCALAWTCDFTVAADNAVWLARQPDAPERAPLGATDWLAAAQGVAPDTLRRWWWLGEPLSAAQWQAGSGAPLVRPGQALAHALALAERLGDELTAGYLPRLKTTTSHTHIAAFTAHLKAQAKAYIETSAATR